MIGSPVPAAPVRRRPRIPAPRLVRVAAAMGLAACAVGVARGDGGLVRASATQDGLTVTLFTDPTPLRAGQADVSVLVQDAATRTPLLDARVDLHLARADAAQDRATVRLTRDAADNKLLQAARLDLPEPGRWSLRAEVLRGTARATATAEVHVAPAAGRLRALWPALAAPPVAIALFALHQALRRRRLA